MISHLSKDLFDTFFILENLSQQNINLINLFTNLYLYFMKFISNKIHFLILKLKNLKFFN